MNFFKYYYVKVYVKDFKKISIWKVLKPIYKFFFFYLNPIIIMFNECFWKHFIHWTFFKLIHMFQWYNIRKSYTFKTKSNHHFYKWKTKNALHLCGFCLCGIHSSSSSLHYILMKCKLLQSYIRIMTNVRWIFNLARNPL